MSPVYNPPSSGGGLGAWATGTSYALGQVVVSGGSLFQALDVHTAGATFAGDSVHWARVTPTRTGSPLLGWPCASGCGMVRGYIISGQSNGTDTGANYRSAHTLLTKAGAVRIVWVNENSSGIGNLLGNITLSGAIEETSDIVPVSFNGTPTIVLPPGGMAICDPIYVGQDAASTLWVRTHLACSAGDKWAFNRYVQSARSEGVESGTGSPATTDKTLVSSATVTAATAHGFVPVAILAQEKQRTTVTGHGDSIMIGNNDGIDFLDKGFLSRVLIPANIPYFNAGRSGEAGSLFTATNGSAALGRRTRIELAAIGDYVVDGYGINDIQNNVFTTLPTLQAAAQARWQRFIDRGQKVYACTLTPKTTSTDAWATTGNQTKALTGPQETLRTAYNDWLRTLPSPLTGFFETSDAVESARNSGIWKAGAQTSDGLHPNATGSAAMAAAITAATFT